MFKRKTPALPLPRPLKLVLYGRYFLFFLLLVFALLYYVIIPGADKYRRLEGLAIDSQDNVYVADSSNTLIRKFDKHGNLLASWGSEGSGDGQFARYSAPYRLAVGPGDIIYVLDSYNNRIQKFDSNGKFLGKFGTPGNGPGQFNRPENMVVDNQGQLYVWQINTLQKYDASGNYLGNFGLGQSAVGKLAGYGILAVDTVGNIYIGGEAQNKFLVFNPQGQLLRTLTFLQYGFRYLSVDRQGFLYFTDDGGKELFKTDPTGNVLARWPLGGEKYGMGRYTGTAFDSQGNTYVLKYYGSTVDVYDANGQQIKEFSVGWPEWLTENFTLFFMGSMIFSLSLTIFEIIYRKRHKLELPQQKLELTAESRSGKISQLTCLTASLLGLFIGFPAAVINSVINPGAISTAVITGVMPGPDPQKVFFAWFMVVLYILVLIMVFFVKTRPVIAGILQIGAGGILFFTTDVLALKVLPIAIIIGGALALLDTGKKDSAPGQS